MIHNEQQFLLERIPLANALGNRYPAIIFTVWVASRVLLLVGIRAILSHQILRVGAFRLPVLAASRARISSAFLGTHQPTLSPSDISTGFSVTRLKFYSFRRLIHKSAKQPDSPISQGGKSLNNSIKKMSTSSLAR